MFLDAYGGQILFVPTAFSLAGNHYDDIAAARDVINKMKHQDRVVLIDHQYNDRVLKGLIALGNAAVGMRYHFVVFALSSGVPAFALSLNEYYDQKMKGVMDTFNQGSCWTRLAEVNSENNLIRSISSLLDRARHIQAELRATLDELRPSAYTAIERVKEILLGQ